MIITLGVIEVPINEDIDITFIGVVLFEITSVCEANANSGLPIT